MPEYEHELMLSPIKRIVEDAKSGEKQLFYGMYKTPEREKFFHYSLPCRISPPTYIVIRKNEFEKFGKENQVSFKNLLENSDFKFLMLNSISFGPGIDELLELHRNNPNVLIEYNTTNMGAKSLKLLLNNRVDYILSLDGISYDANEQGVSNQLNYLKIQEQAKYQIGYITAPKTQWGEHMIEKVNNILRKEIPRESFFQMLKPLVGRGMLPEFKREFNKKILEPSQN